MGETHRISDVEPQTASTGGGSAAGQPTGEAAGGAAGEAAGLVAFEPWPSGVQVHMEWGTAGALLAASRGDLVVVVDVLSFSTSVVEVIARDGLAFCYSPEELDAAGGRDTVGRRHDAVVLSKQRRVAAGELSLSPASLQSTPPGARVVMTSLNGGRCVAAAARAPWVGIGCLTNRTAVARRIEELLAAGVADRCTIVPCAEVWSSPFMASQVGDLSGLESTRGGGGDGGGGGGGGRSGGSRATRPAFEDLLGAGAIVAAMAPGVARSVEAQMAAAVFDANAARLGQVLRDCVSGRELSSWGFGADVEVASGLDRVTLVPERHTKDPPHRFARTAATEVGTGQAHLPD